LFINVPFLFILVLQFSNLGSLPQFLQYCIIFLNIPCSQLCNVSCTESWAPGALSCNSLSAFNPPS
jgi:hypothetical protein